VNLTDSGLAYWIRDDRVRGRIEVVDSRGEVLMAQRVTFAPAYGPHGRFGIHPIGAQHQVMDLPRSSRGRCRMRYVLRDGEVIADKILGDDVVGVEIAPVPWPSWATNPQPDA